MTRQQWLFVGFGILVVVWLLIQFGRSSNDPDIAIPIDDDAIADLPAFAQKLDNSPITDVRLSLASLARPQHEFHDRHAEVFQVIVKASSQDDVREAAIVAWRRTDSMDEATLDELVKNDSAEGIRIQAVREIDERKLWRVIPALLVALQDESETVRQEAHTAIRHRLGFQLGYEPTQSPAQREHWVQLYRNNYEAMKDLLEAEEQLNATKN